MQAPHVTRSAGERGGDDEGGELVAIGVEAHRDHAVLVDLDAFEHAAEQRTEQKCQDQIHGDELHKRNVVGGPAALRSREGLGIDLEAEGGNQRLGQISAIRATAELGVVEDEENHLPERERDHQEEEAFGAQRQRADNERDHSGDGHGRRQRLPDRPRRTFGRQEEHHISSEPVEGAVAEADEARGTDQEVQTERQHGANHRRRGEADVVGSRHEGQQHEHGDKSGEAHPPEPRLRQHTMRIAHVRAPNRPVGRNSNTTIMRM